MLKKLVIDRSKWACGRPGPNEDGNRLLNKNGMCCLGFYARQAGYSAKTIRGLAMPTSILNYAMTEKKVALAKKRFDKLIDKNNNNSVLADKLASINDSDKHSSKQREVKVAAIFKKLGTRVVFTGKYRKPKAA